MSRWKIFWYKLKCKFNKHAWYYYYETFTYPTEIVSQDVRTCLVCGITQGTQQEITARV